MRRTFEYSVDADVGDPPFRKKKHYRGVKLLIFLTTEIRQSFFLSHHYSFESHLPLQIGVFNFLYTNINSLISRGCVVPWRMTIISRAPWQNISMNRLSQCSSRLPCHFVFFLCMYTVIPMLSIIWVLRPSPIAIQGLSSCEVRMRLFQGNMVTKFKLPTTIEVTRYASKYFSWIGQIFFKISQHKDHNYVDEIFKRI